MCGRFVSTAPPDEIARYFDVDRAPGGVLEPSYNVAPSNDVYVVLETGGHRQLEAMHWGLVPSWAKDPKVGNRMINARAETLAERNAFRNAFRKRRCILPANGFYEWKAQPGEKKKQPYYICRSDGGLMAFAGLWEIWRPDESSSERLHSCTIITGPPNEKVAALHDRMPIILPPSAWSPWLNPHGDIDAIGDLLVPAPAELLDVHPVSVEVNNPRNKGPGLIESIDGGTSGP